MEIKKQIPDVLNKGTDLITWERGARVPACTVCIPRLLRRVHWEKSAYTTRISVCHGYSTSTKQHSYVFSISAVLRLPLDIYGNSRFVLSFYLCVYLVFLMSIFNCTTTCFASNFDVDIPCVQALASFHAGQFRVPCGKTRGKHTSWTYHFLSFEKSAFCEEAALGVTFNPGRFIDALCL